MVPGMCLPARDRHVDRRGLQANIIPSGRHKYDSKNAPPLLCSRTQPTDHRDHRTLVVGGNNQSATYLSELVKLFPM